MQNVTKTSVGIGPASLIGIGHPTDVEQKVRSSFEQHFFTYLFSNVALSTGSRGRNCRIFPRTNSNIAHLSDKCIKIGKNFESRLISFLSNLKVGRPSL
jgi:hypothetical protein